MIVKKNKKIDVIIKEAYIDSDSNGLVDVETGEIVDLNSVIEKVYGDKEVKITITASSTEEVELDKESNDSDE